MDNLLISKSLIFWYSNPPPPLRFDRNLYANSVIPTHMYKYMYEFMKVEMHPSYCICLEKLFLEIWVKFW